MIEYDEARDKTRAFKVCMRECKEICEASAACKARTQNDPSTLCREGSDDGFMVDGYSFDGCEHLLPHSARQPDEPKRPFEVSDLWKLFEAK